LMGALQDQSAPYTLRRYQHVSGVNTRPAGETQRRLGDRGRQGVISRVEE
jgi:hypothetical protein